MAQTYSLEEAAEKLGLAADEFKKRLKTDTDYQKLRSFRDGATLRFRAADIDEMARAMGAASDPGSGLSAAMGAPPQNGSSDEFLLPNDLSPSDTSGDDIFSFSAGDSGKVPQKGKSDSDIRLDYQPPRGGNDPGSGLTEEIELDLGGPGASGSSTRLTAPKSGPNLGGPLSSTKIPGPPPTSDLMSGDSSSEFELSLDADSDSFELQLNADQSEEIDIGGSAGSGQGGLNLSNPKDSGVSLESSEEMASTDSDDFELSLDSDSSLDELANADLAPPSVRNRNDSDSEFELTLDAGSSETDSLAGMIEEEAAPQGDIFETDFELPAVTEDADSGSEVVAVESSDTDLENSDFDLALDESDIQAVDEDESASQVVLLDEDSSDEDGGGNAALLAAGAAGAVGAAALAGRGRKKVNLDDDEASEDDDGASTQLRGVNRRDMDDDDAPKGYAPPAKWGPLPAMVLLPCLFLTTIGGLMSYELLRGMWGYHNNQTASGSLASGIAGLLGKTDGKK